MGILWKHPREVSNKYTYIWKFILNVSKQCSPIWVKYMGAHYTQATGI